MSLRDKIPLIRSEKRIVRYTGYVLYSILCFFVFLIIVGALVSSPDRGDSEEQVDKEYVNITFDEFDGLFGRGSDLTDYQKKERFKEEYKGKYVIWSGEIDEVSEDGRKVRMKCKESTILFDLIVKLRSDQKQELLGYQKGDIITVEGMLYSYSESFGHRLVDGVILERR